MKILFHREAFKALKGNKLMKNEKVQFSRAIENFQDNFRHPGLNFERLGSGEKQNHYSIRASRELRLILAIDDSDLVLQQPEKAVVVNLGHHDQMYEWAMRQQYSTDISGAHISEAACLNDAKIENRSNVWLESWLRREEWHLFLHPSQKKTVSRTFNKQARVYGGAGTGKTVIGLHRIARLARESPQEKFLVTAFHKTLIRHLEDTFSNLPEAPKNVEFCNVDKIASDICRANGYRQNVDTNLVNDAFEAAYRDVIAGSVLEACTPAYIREEVDRVIKGRAATRDEYLATDKFHRLGRRHRFNGNYRQKCWDFHVKWNHEMDKRQTTNFADKMLRAMEIAENNDKPRYRSVFVDEGQDLTMTALRLICALVAGKRGNSIPQDGLLFAIDKAQQLYAGGVVYGWAGLEFGGNSVRLTKGLRTTRQIALAAAHVRGQDLIDKTYADEVAIEPEAYRRDGPKPYFVQTVGKEIPKMIEIINKIKSENPDLHEIGVIMHRVEDAIECVKAFRKKGVPACYQKSAEGSISRTSQDVKVVTFDSSKGLEFHAVLIPRIDKSMFPLTKADQDALNQRQGADETGQKNHDGEVRERRQLNLDRLYVGMTRARDLLFLISSGEPCKEIQDAEECFDWYPVSRPIELPEHPN